jgi:hypothetical protein
MILCVLYLFSFCRYIFLPRGSQVSNKPFLFFCYLAKVKQLIKAYDMEMDAEMYNNAPRATLRDDGKVHRRYTTVHIPKLSTTPEVASFRHNHGHIHPTLFSSSE